VSVAKISTSRCSHSQPISAPVASDGNPISIALARNACSFGIGCGRRLAVGRTQAHMRQRIDEWQPAGISARADIPGATARLHRMVHGGAPFADGIAFGIGDDK